MPKKKGELSIEKRLEQSIVAKEEEPYKLPSNWVWTRLGDIFTIERGGSPRPIKDFLVNDIDGINWIKIGDTELGKKYINSTKEKIKKEGIKKSRYVKKGDLLLTNSMSFGRAYILNCDGCIHDGWLVLKPILDKLNREYFYYLLNSRYMYNIFSELAKGSTVKNLNKDLVKTVTISLPPLEEQKRIVEKLDSLFEKIQKIKEIIEEVKEKTTSRREAILSKAFSGELTEKWRGENHTENARELLVKINDEKLKLWEDECKKAEDEGRKKPAKPKLKTIDEMLIGAEEEPYKLPNNWVWTRLGDITDINPKKKILDFNDDEEISFVPMKAVSDETGKIEEMEYEKYSKLKKGYTQFIEEDVLFAKITPCMENGKCAIAKNLKNDIGYGTTEFHVLRCYQGIINKLLHIFLRQESFRKEAKYNMTGSVGFQRVPVDFLKTALFPLPPLEEQKEIVRVLDKVFEEENRISELISLENKIEILEKTILDRAFRGELGTGNNDDEPAIELLKKCLEER